MKINPSVVCEQVGDDVVVLDPENSAVVTLTGDSAVVVRRLLAGDTVSDTEPGVEELFAQGVLVSESSTGLSRRSLMMSGVAVGAGGVLALSLPAAANASSASLPTPDFDFYQARAAVDDRNNPDLVFVIEIPEDEFMNAGSFPDGFILEWSFSQSFDELYVFDFVEGGGVDFYVWDDLTNGVTIPPERVDGRDLTIFVRVRSGNRLSPVVEIVLTTSNL